MKESRTLSCKLSGSQSSWRDYRWLYCSVYTICLWTWWERHNTVSCSSSPWLINNWLVIFTAFGDVYTLLPVVPLLLGIMGSELLEAKCKWRKTAQVANHQTYHTPSDLSRSQESYVTAIACSSCLHSILNKILVLACTTEQLFMNASSSLLGNCSVSCTRTSIELCWFLHKLDSASASPSSVSDSVVLSFMVLSQLWNSLLRTFVKFVACFMWAWS